MTTSNCVIEVKMLQNPVKLSYVMAINKEGQTLSVAGIDLRSSCFSHEQLMTQRKSVFIPTIPMTLSDGVTDVKMIQNPVKLSHAMTINKESQILSVTGIDLRSSCFFHEQLYAARKIRIHPQDSNNTIGLCHQS